MADAARSLYDSLSQYSDLENLINVGETEGLYLECKAPGNPQLSQDLRAKFAKVLSGFSNTAGGVVIWGISTTPHQHNKLDVLTQLEPIANCRHFLKQIEKAFPTLTTPGLTNIESKVITQKPDDTRGIVLTYIPKGRGDPIQSNSDDIFYYRSGDNFTPAPHELIKRLFAATDSPDLKIRLDFRVMKKSDDGLWEIPFILENGSSAIAEHCVVMVKVTNPELTERIVPEQFRDMSIFNPGERRYVRGVDDVIHKYLGYFVGKLRIQLKKDIAPEAKVEIEVMALANRMVARICHYEILFEQNGYTLETLKDNVLVE